jgi:hypothetical protein
MKDIVFCSMITENYKNTKIEYDLFYKSFKKFNSGAELVIFEDEDMKRIFNKNSHASFTNWKTSLAKELYNDYKIVVILDTDHFIFDELTEIIDCNYEVGVTSNYNDYLNTALNVVSDMNGNPLEMAKLVDDINYYQGGLVAGNKHFWDAYDYACLKQASKFPLLGENNVLNLLLSIYPFKIKIFDGHTDYRNSEFKAFYNCSSLMHEKEFVIHEDKVKFANKPVKLYHVARGGNHKPKFNDLFSQQVVTWFNNKIGN